MKRILIVLTSLTLVSLLSGCQSSSSEPPIVSPLVISKLITASTQRNNVIELYNTSAEPVTLTSYQLNFYTNGASEISTSIMLSGTIAASSFYVIGSSNNNVPDFLSTIDFSYLDGSLPFNGNDAIELAYGTQAIDLVGTLGSDYEFSRNQTLIRIGEKTIYAPSPTFDRFNFISYVPDLFTAIKQDTHQIKTLEQLYAGPALEARYQDLPFVDATNSSLGGGGAIRVTNNAVYDGDTAAFAATGQFGGGSVRYFYINTPEVQSNYVDAEPWGYVASKYNKEHIMKNASSKTIYIQSMKGGNLKEVNNRYLGLIWVNGALSQFLVTSEGLTEDVPVSFSAMDLEHTDRQVPILTFLQFAEHRAKLNGWGTKGYPNNPDGEKSPDWNYSANGGAGANSTTTPVWTPHLPLPWNVV